MNSSERLQLAGLFMEKRAFILWGGGEVGAHPKGRGVGGSLGYSNLLGILPIPLAGIDIGGPQHGFRMGVSPDPESEIGVNPYIGVRYNHPRSHGVARSFPRGLPEIIYDKIKGRTKEEAMRKSYPELFEEEDNEVKKEKPKEKDSDEKKEEDKDKEKD